METRVPQTVLLAQETASCCTSQTARSDLGLLPPYRGGKIEPPGLGCGRLLDGFREQGLF